MQSINALFDDYSAYHQAPGNKAFHRLGIPMIMLSLIGLLARVKLGPVDAAMLLIVLAEVYYLTIEWRLGALMLAVSIAFYFLGIVLPLWANAALFILTRACQFIRHNVDDQN